MLRNRTLFIVATAFIALTISTTGAYASNDSGDDQRDYKHRAYKKHHHHERKIRVDCDDGQTLRKALEMADAGDTIIVSGTCRESVVIKTDGLTLDGRGSAVIDGSGLPSPTPSTYSLRDAGLITIDTARDVTIRGLSIVQSPNLGVAILRGASVDLEDMHIENTAFVGIYIYENATVEITDTTVTNGGFGILLNGNSYLALNGEINSTGNGGDGIGVWGESTLDLLEATIELSNNGRAGLLAFDAQVHTNAIAFVGPCAVSATDNGLAGIVMAAGASLIFSRATSINATGNPSGVVVSNGGSLSDPLGVANFQLANNEVGMRVDRGSRAVLVGELMITENTNGLESDNATNITLERKGESIPTIVGNYEQDVVLSFGSRVTFKEVQFDSISCDDTVLTRDADGNSLCP